VFLPFTFASDTSPQISAISLVSAIQIEFARLHIDIDFKLDKFPDRVILPALSQFIKQAAQHVVQRGGRLWLLLDEIQVCGLNRVIFCCYCRLMNVCIHRIWNVVVVLTSVLVVA
jgi:hypothetical protein